MIPFLSNTTSHLHTIGKMVLAKQDHSLWITNVDQLPKAIMPKPPDRTLMSDSSLKGWGGVIEGTSCVAPGRWSHQESQLLINLFGIEGRSASLAGPL